MAVVRGMDFKLYRNSSIPATPTWVLMVNVRDVTRNLEKNLADASIRGSTFRLQVGTLKDLSLEWQMVYDKGDADLAAIEDAYYDDTNIEFAVLDGPLATDDSAGLRFMGQITNFTVNEALEDVGLVDVTVVPAYDSANLPRRVIADTGVLTDA